MAQLKVPVSSEDHIQGSSKALVTLVEYGDYECPFCGSTHPIIKKLESHFGDKLRFVFRNFPLREIHAHAEGSAEAAEYAASQNKFWEMHDLIYENQEDLSLEGLQAMGQSIGLDPKEIEIAILSRQFEEKIRKDFMGGVKSGVNGTPSFYINDHKYEGRYLFPDLKAAIEKML